MEVAEMVMTGRHRRVPIIRGHLGSALYRQRVVFGGETVEVRDADRSAFGGIFGIREYPASTTPTQFQSLLEVDFAFVLTQSFRSDEHRSELQSLMRTSYAVFCLKKKRTQSAKSTQPVPRTQNDTDRTPHTLIQSPCLTSSAEHEPSKHKPLRRL